MLPAPPPSRHARLGVGVWACAALVWAAPPAAGQGGAAQADLTLNATAQGGAASVDAGAEAYGRGRLAEAEALLLDALARDSLGVGGRPARSVGYWLGAVHEAQADSARARAAWLAGLRRGARRGVLDVAAADAFVRSAFGGRDGASYVAAETAYFHLLRSWGPGLGGDDRDIVSRHVAQALLVVPDGDALEDRPDAGTALVAFWGGEDPLPASALNERVVEHLERVAAGLRAYPGRGPTGLDDRGDVYVRLGAPTRTRVIDFYTPEFVRRINELRRSVGNDLLVEPSDFADNEVWVYEGLGERREAYSFLFIGEGRDYRVGQTVDLIPSRLRVGFDRNTGRGGAKADVVLEALRTVYRQLSVEGVSFGERYNDVEGYLSEMEMLRSRSEGQSRARARTFGRQGDNVTSRSDYSAVAMSSGTSGPEGGTPPDIAVRGALETARREDEVLRAQREANVPPGRSRVLDRIEPFPVSARFSRFLDPDGTTRLEVDWASLPGALAVGAEVRAAAGAMGFGDYRDTVVRASLVRGPGGAGRHVEQVEFITVPERDAAWASAVRARTVTVREGRGRLDVALQWDQYVARLLPDSVALGPRARVAVVGVETPDPLRAGPLELSDLRPLRSADREPFPYERVAAGDPLSVYFEIYGLDAFAGRFRVDYEVVQRQRGSIFRRDREETSGGRLISRVEGDRAEEYLILDTSGWAEADEVEVRVRVTAGAGEAVERTVRFEVADE